MSFHDPYFTNLALCTQYLSFKAGSRVPVANNNISYLLSAEGALLFRALLLNFFLDKHKEKAYAIVILSIDTL